MRGGGFGGRSEETAGEGPAGGDQRVEGVGEIRVAAARADGATGALAKELMRRTVLLAAEAGRPPRDEDLAEALDALVSARGALTRRLLGASPGDAGPDVSASR